MNDTRAFIAKEMVWRSVGGSSDCVWLVLMLSYIGKCVCITKNEVFPNLKRLTGENTVRSESAEG